MICTAVEKSVRGTITVRTRPLSMNPPLDSFAKAVCDPIMTVKLIAVSTKWKLPKPEVILDRLLLVLFDALFLDMCQTWTERRVSNLHCSETIPLAKYFIKGLSVPSCRY